MDQLNDVAGDAGVRAIPAFHFFKGGKKVDELSGADPSKLKSIIQKHASGSTVKGAGGGFQGTGHRLGDPSPSSSQLVHDVAQLSESDQILLVTLLDYGFSQEHCAKGNCSHTSLSLFFSQLTLSYCGNQQCWRRGSGRMAVGKPRGSNNHNNHNINYHNYSVLPACQRWRGSRKRREDGADQLSASWWRDKAASVPRDGHASRPDKLPEELRDGQTRPIRIIHHFPSQSVWQ